MRAKATRILVLSFAVGATLAAGGSPLTLGQGTRGQTATPTRGRSAGLEEADRLNQRAMALYREGRYAEAIPLEREAVGLYEAARGPYSPDLADKLNTLAVMLKRQGEYHAARPLYERALSIYEKASGRESGDVAEVLNNLGLLLEAQADYGAARQTLERALRIRMNLLGPDHQLTALTMSNLGELLRARGDYASARPLLERALEVRIKILGPDDAYVSESLNNLAAWYRETGDYVSARRLLERSVVVCEKSLGPDHPACATTLENLGGVIKLQGDYKAARPLFERAVRIDEKALGPDHPDLATALDKLASLLEDQGDSASAQTLYERALRIREKALGPAHPEVAISLGNLAVFQGNFIEARRLYEQALSIDERVFGRDNPNVASSLTNLSTVLIEQGDYASAQPLLQRALGIAEKAYGPDHPQVADVLYTLATLFLRRGDSARARPLLERSLSINERSLGPNNPVMAPVLLSLGNAEWQSRDFPAARGHFLRAGAAVNSFADRILPTLSFAEQLSFTETQLPEQTSWLLSANRQGADLENAYSLLFRWKGLLTDLLRRRSAVLRLSKDPRYAQKVERLQGVRAEVAGLFHKGGTLPAEQWKQKNDALTQEKERLERELATALAPDVLTDPLGGAGLRAFQSVLRPDEAFVDVYRYTYGPRFTNEEERYGAVITTSSGGPVLVDLGASQKLNGAASAWHDSVMRDQSGEEQWRVLSAAVWGPLANSLPKNVHRIYLSPDGELARIPWQLMPSSSPATKAVLLSQSDSPRELFMLRRRGRSGANATTARNLLLVGGVDFNAGSSAGDRGGARFRELPSTGVEVKDIEALARANRFSVVELTGAGASKGAVEAKLAGATFAHLATHGFFYTEPERASPAMQVATRAGGGDLLTARNVRNPLVESGLALAGANARAASTIRADGILTAEEMVGLDLTHCEMVTLSACETGRGEQVTGQGVIGLRSAVIAAGARGVVMSLWKVPDEATSELMKAFYSNLWNKKMTPAESLLRAQETLRDDPSGKFRQPRNWAGWVLTGESW